MRKLSTQQDVINALGLERVYVLTGANRKQVWHWTARAKQFPGYTYVKMMRALHRRGCSAPDTLWNMTRKNNAA